MPRIMSIALVALVALGVVAPGAPAFGSGGKQVRYVGIHPIPKAEGSGICYIEGPHVHIFDADRIQYREHRGASYFVGDPVAYGYDGSRYVYKGHHPIRISAVVGYGDPDDTYCYLDGPHYHYFAPVEGPEWERAGDAYFYVGEPPHAYIEARPAMMKINAVYQPLVYERPVVTVEAPVGWIGARAEFVTAAPAVVVAPPRRAVVAPRAGVSVQAVIPMPSLHIDIGVGAPAVIVHERPVIIEHRGKVKVKRDHRRH